jgi:Flp pilus assembly pilin Flp
LKRLFLGRGSRRGATAVEFALLAVPLLIGVVGGLDGLRYIYTWQALRGYAAQSFRVVAIAASSGDESSCPALSAGMLDTLAKPIGLDSNRLTVVPSCSLNTTTGIRTLRLQISYRFTFITNLFDGLGPASIQVERQRQVGS